MKQQYINILVNNKTIKAKKGDNLLNVLLNNGFDIPHLCFHKDLGSNHSCRTCIVEVDGKIVQSCEIKINKPITVKTQTKKVIDIRTTNLELLLAQHTKLCKLCQQNKFCKTKQKIKLYKLNENKYKAYIKKEPIRQSWGDALEYDNNLCINCKLCEKACIREGIAYISVKGFGQEKRIQFCPFDNIDCIYCGQCSLACPTGAIREKDHTDKVLEFLENKENIVIAQMAPAVRVSIGEEFGLEPGVNLEKQMYTALRKLGFDKIYDVLFGADLTTLIEGEELVENLKNKKGPVFSSCCPSWVKFLEFYYPDMIPYLSKARPPHQHSSLAYKIYLSKKLNKPIENIKVVSIMPCTSKKYEINLDEVKYFNIKPVDVVITTREMARLLKQKNIDPVKCKKSEPDKFGLYSGSGAIYGATGGVAESVLRYVYFKLTNKKLPKLKFEQLRNNKGIKKVNIKINDKTINIAVVTTPLNARKILNEIRQDKTKYDFVEFMACPGGCIGGGGQPIPTNEDIIEKRKKGLYNIDDKNKIHYAFENKQAIQFLDFLKTLTKQEQENFKFRKFSKKTKSN